MTKQREAFEKFAVTRGYDISRHDIYADGYVFDDTHHAWVTWQAAQADKLDFSRKVADAVLDAAIDIASCYSRRDDIHDQLVRLELSEIIAKVEQGQ